MLYYDLGQFNYYSSVQCPGSLWCGVKGTSLCLPLRLPDGPLDIQPHSVSPAVEVLFQFSDGTFVGFLCPAGAVIVQADGQFLKGHTLLLRLSKPKVAAYQVQFPWGQNLLHALEKQDPPHIAVISFCGITAPVHFQHPVPQVNALEQGLALL